MPVDLENLTQAQASWLLGISARSLRDQVTCPRNANQKYNGRALIGWVREQAADSDAALLAGSDSPNLERLRAAKATLAEIEVAKATREAMSSQQVHDILARCAAILRRLGTRLGQRFGNDAVQMLNDKIDEFTDELNRSFADTPIERSGDDAPPESKT